MATTTTKAPSSTKIAEPATSKGEVVVFQPPRLPYHEAVTERFGVDRGQWKVLVEAIFPAAKTIDSVVMALAYCKARKLDVFKRPVHIVPMWSKALGKMVETVWPGISEIRTTATRTKDYAGKDETIFGPMKSQTFKGTIAGYRNEPDREVKASVKFPEWGQITLYRIVGGEARKFVGPKVYWLEAYGRIGQTTVPNEMWQKRPNGQLDKCAEAAALRVAFPEEIGNELTAEEMEGQTLSGEHETITIAPPAPPVPPAPPASAAPAAGTRTPPAPPGAGASKHPDNSAAVSDRVHEGRAAADTPPTDTKALLAWIDDKLKAVTPEIVAEYPAILDEMWTNDIEPHLKGKFPPDVDAALGILREHEKRLSP